MFRGVLSAMAGLAAAACAGTGTAPEGPASSHSATSRAFDSVVVFGDSLVDAGNARILSNGRRAAPEQGYVAGRITNGYTFADRIAMGVAGQVTSPSRAGGNNYAHAGARALADADPIPDAMAQVEAYRARLRGRPDARTLFILTFGGNDLRGSQDAPGPGGPEQQQVVARSYAEAVRALFGMGARTVLVTGVPIPGQAGASLQRALDAELDRIVPADGQRLLRYDFLPFWARFLPNAPSLGFRPWSVPQPNCVEDRAQASGCATYILFDRVHPVAAVHALIARDISEKLGIPVADPPAASSSD